MDIPDQTRIILYKSLKTHRRSDMIRSVSIALSHTDEVLMTSCLVNTWVVFCRSLFIIRKWKCITFLYENVNPEGKSQ